MRNLGTFKDQLSESDKAICTQIGAMSFYLAEKYKEYIGEYSGPLLDADIAKIGSELMLFPVTEGE